MRTCPRVTCRRAAALLGEGHLILMPTDTVYGIAASPRVVSAARKLFRAKGRAPGKPVALLAAGRRHVERFGARMDETEARLADRFWPGPLTLVLAMRGRSKREGFRVPDHPRALRLLRAAGGVLRVTSANRSGDAPAVTPGEAVRALGKAAAGIVDAGRCPRAVPSTVVQVVDGRIMVLRKGVLTARDLLRAVGRSGRNGVRR